ncbi:hypothetical protein K502DRAFT_365303 [Neoconidiobolus thromboides FSU 785]|nr:hypothetical protein K502DRAFT_365303 [Neoconidiobolus thromboides FSU 785]
MLHLGQIVLVIISMIGLILNLLVGSIVAIGLKLSNSDLILVLIIALNDIVYYSNNILRTILSNSDIILVNSDSLIQIPKWWCIYDVTITLPTLELSIDLVAVLSLMRYCKIFVNRPIPNYVFYSMALFLVSLSFTLVSIHHYYGYYGWSATKMYCLPTTYTPSGPEDPNQLSNVLYYDIYFVIFVIRYLISLSIITFCYFSISRAYRKVIRQSLTHSSQGNHNRLDYSQFKEDLNVEDNNQNIRIINQCSTSSRIKRAVQMLKLIAPTLAYVLCLLPDAIQTFTVLVLGVSFSTGAKTAINSLCSCTGIVSALFVLFSHAPTRTYFFNTFDKIFSTNSLL